MFSTTVYIADATEVEVTTFTDTGSKFADIDFIGPGANYDTNTLTLRVRTVAEADQLVRIATELRDKFDAGMKKAATT